ncbi:MAG: hypothetical protein WDO15_21780 [Bacteroidota bacterium]
MEEGTQVAYSLQPLEDLHLKSEGIFDGARNSNVEAIPQGNPLYVSMFTVAAIFVLLISAINYTNLTTARAFRVEQKRSVWRKAIGAMRNNLVGQFLFESLMITCDLVCACCSHIESHTTGLQQLRQQATFAGFQNRLQVLADRNCIRDHDRPALWKLWRFVVVGTEAIGIIERPEDQEQPRSFRETESCRFSSSPISIVMIIATIVLFLQVKFLNNTDLDSIET